MLAASLLCLSACGSLSYEVEGPPPAGPPANKARVIFTFNQGYPFGLEAYVVEGEKLHCYLENEEYCIVDVPAGRHRFILISENDEALEGDFMAGKTYQVRIYATPGVFGARTYWAPLGSSGEDLEQRKEDVEECELVALHDDKASKWEESEAEDLRDHEESFAEGKDKASHVVGPEHAL